MHLLTGLAVFCAGCCAGYLVCCTEMKARRLKTARQLRQRRATVRVLAEPQAFADDGKLR